MTEPSAVADLFGEEPFRWGFRGDPHLWREMRERFAAVPRPDTVEELVSLIEAAFRELTGYPISQREPFWMERYDHGGMSSGMISPDFWRDSAIPLLSQRYAEG